MPQFPAQQNDSAQDEQVTIIGILIFGLLAGALAIIYLILTPNRYEAVALIMMVQIALATNSVRASVWDRALAGLILN